MVKVVQNYPRKVEWRIQNTMVDIHSKLSQLGKWKMQNIGKGANRVAHQLVPWAASIINNGDHSVVPEHLWDLTWKYEVS